MPEPTPNPHVSENNAREEARQELRCTQRCVPGLVHPDCEKHGIKPMVRASAAAPVIERLTDNYSELQRLVFAMLTQFAKANPRSWHFKSVYPEIVALAEFIDFKP